jgi:hypothetical protein
MVVGVVADRERGADMLHGSEGNRLDAGELGALQLFECSVRFGIEIGGDDNFLWGNKGFRRGRRAAVDVQHG